MAAELSTERTQRWRLAIFLVLCLPLIALAIGVAVQAKYQGDLVSAVQEGIGRQLTADELAQVQIGEFCADPQYSSDPVCGDVAIAAATRVLAVVTLGAGVLLLGFIAFCTVRARRDRDALLRLFKPGLYVTLVGVAVLVILDALLALASVYLGLGVFAERVYPVLLLGIAAGALLGIVGMIRALIGTTRHAVTREIGVRRDAAAEPGLHALIGEIATQVGAELPDNVLVGLDPTFFVTHADVEATDGLWRGRNLYLSLPLLRILQPGELRAVLGHELGHFRGRDAAYSERFYPIYRGTGEALGRLSAAGSGGARAIALLPAIAMLSVFYDGFSTAERAISRDRELAADQVGAEAASARDLGSALVKLAAFTREWGPTMEAVVTAASTPSPVDNAADRFVELVRAAAIPSALDGLDARDVPHPTDSHPPISQRLEALGLTQADLASAGLAVTPEPASDAILVSRERDAATLTAWVNARVSAAVVEDMPAPAPA